MIDYFDARSHAVVKMSVFDSGDYVRLRVVIGVTETLVDMSPRQARKVARSMFAAARAVESPPEEP